MAYFNGAQSFYIDPSVVEGSDTVDISAVSMYFMYRPSATNNRSGINYPGVNVFLTDVVDKVPNLANNSITQNIARAEWNAVKTSSDASQETVFTFANPITVKTGGTYAFCWAYDGGEDFLPWTNIKGNYLVGTHTDSTGPSSTYGGNYFLFSSVVLAGANVTSTSSYVSNWSPLAGTDAKFQVHVARYAVDGVPVAANLNNLPLNTPVFTSNVIIEYLSNVNMVEMSSPCPRIENISFDMASSTKQAYVGAQRAFQNTVHYPGGGVYATVSSVGSNTLTANTTMSNGANFSWNTIFGGYTGDRYVVIDYGTSYDVREVTKIISNTVIALDEATTAANSAAKIMITPVAMVDSFNATLFNGKDTSLMFLRDSSANATVRFTNRSVNFANVVITTGGTGYKNTDVFYVAGFENVQGAITSNYLAVANISTNSSGGVLALNFSNTGAGFVNTAQTKFVVLSGANATVNTATANTSTGSGLVPTMQFASVIVTEQTNNVFYNTRPINLDVHTLTSVMNVPPASNTSQYTFLTTLYYLANNASTANGKVTYVGNSQVFSITPNNLTYLNNLPNIPVIASRSNEFGILYANGAVNDQVSAINPYSLNYELSIETQSTNDYQALGPFYSPLLDFGRYIVNNDYTNENTDAGNAYARHITTIFNMTGPANTNQMAEDLRFYVSAWRPPGSDIQAFARIQNSADSESFIDEDWTRLALVNGSNTYSTSGYVDLTYGFQGQPNTFVTLAGTVTTTNNSAVITGTGTNWSNTLSNNSLVKIYDPLFANSNFSVMSVVSIASNTSVTLDQVFSTNTTFGVGGFELAGRGGLLMDVLTYPNQAFNNIQNDNVVRYYNQSEHIWDGFNTLQIKCVLLTNDPHNIPRIHNIRGIGLSA